MTPSLYLPVDRVGRSLWVTCALALTLAVSGCSETKHSPFERFEHLPTTEKLETVSLGVYVIPVPLPATDDAPLRQVQVEFELFAAVVPRHKRHVLDEVTRMEGRMRDGVIEACRHTPVDDLLAPMLTTFKGHLVETVQPYFAHVAIERLHVAEIQIKAL
jgi:hypothetical protein